MELWLRHVVGWGGLGAIALSAVWLVLNPTALRDSSTQSPRPYSLSRAQLAWWTLLILAASFGVYAWKGEFWSLNTTCLALLGIGGGTSVAGRIVDTRQRQALVPRHQDAAPSCGFFNDILSDGSGISVHRFQLVAFNITYGLSFLVGTFEDPASAAFPSFDSTTLLVLGVSASVYLSIKPSEAVPATTVQQPGVSSALSATSASTPAESGPVELSNRVAQRLP